MVQTLYLVRHGQTAWNKEFRMQGQFDSQLTELGREQARLNAEGVAREGVDAIVASPLGRVRASMAPLLELTGLEPSFDDDLKEWHAGDWSGELYANLQDRWPEAWSQWQHDPWTHGSPGGENLTQLMARGEAAIDKALRRPEERLALICHGFILRMMAGSLLGLAQDEIMDIATPNDRVLILQSLGKTWTVQHMDAGGAPKPGLEFSDGT